MALQRTPLESSLLSAAAQRALTPGPARIMAARGLAPLPRPSDVLSVLYQLALDSDPAIHAAADATARDLPEPVLAAALADESLDPRVLDRFAEWMSGRRDMVQRIIMNRSTAGATIAGMAERLDADSVDIIAQNEQRMLAHPEIIGAMFHNRRARMSTVDRAIELAARNHVKVPRIPSWEGVAACIMNTADAGRAPDARPDPRQIDALFANAMRDPDSQTPDSQTPDSDTGSDSAPADDSAARGRIPNVSAMTIPQKIRLATLGSKFARATLVRDANKMVATAAIKAPGVTDSEAAKFAGNHALSDDVIKYITTRRDWTRSYGVKVSLVQNPKTPIPDAIRFMPHLRERELRAIARSRGVPSAVVAQARKLLMTRTAKK